MNMTVEQKVRKRKRFIGIFIGVYFLIVAAYCLVKAVGEKQDLEYRFWADACFRIWVWFVPILFAGVLLLKACIRQWRRKNFGRWILSLLTVGYAGGAVYLSLLYALISAFSLVTDEKMPDGNLVVAVPNGMESIHHYAEPVGLFFRRNISFDEKRTAESLSKIYGVTFQPLKEDNGEWVYGSDVYPDVEVTNITYGFTKANYLDNDFELVLTSRMLEEHQEMFALYGVELVSYIYGRNEMIPEGQGSCTAVLVSEENKELAAEAIAEFIRITLREDLRPDNKSIWDCVNGSIFLVTDTEENGEYQSLRNIPFALKPEYTWIYDASVTASEIAEEIVIKNAADEDVEKELPEAVKEDSTVTGTEVSAPADKGTETGEISPEILEDYLSREPACTFLTEEGMEYRMVAVDRALGSSFYVLIGTNDQGKTCAFVNSNPYNGSGGESRWITFVNENLGFSCLAYSAGANGSLYRTEDGGTSWEVIEYPSARKILPDGTNYNPFVMPEKVYVEDGALFMEAGQGSDSDYYDTELGFCLGLYRSVDQGLNWEFVENIAAIRK